MSNIKNIFSEGKKLIVKDPFSSVNFTEADFDELIPLGEGNQGKVYAVAVHFEGDCNEYRYVVKRLKRRRFLPAASTTSYSFGKKSTTNHPGSACFGTQFSGDFKSETSGSMERAARRAAIESRKKTSFENHKKITFSHETDNSHNIVKLVEIIQHEDEEYALLPYCDIFLDCLIDEYLKVEKFDEEFHICIVCEVILDILDALKHLNYSVDFVHRDIKPENIARCNGKWCLIDFESATKVNSDSHETAGSPYYTHPWCFIDQTKSTYPGNDMYALGQVLKMLLLEPFDFDTNNYYQLYEAKIEKMKSDLKTKWVENQFSSSLSSIYDSPKDSLSRIAKQMCSLMSEQPDIDELYHKINEIKERSVTSPQIPRRVGSILSSFSSDGYFTNSKRDAENFAMKSKTRNESICIKSFSGTDDDDDDHVWSGMAQTSPDVVGGF